MIINKMYCDICGREIYKKTRDKFDYRTVKIQTDKKEPSPMFNESIYTEDYYEICPDCRDKIINFLRENKKEDKDV